ncbi:HD-GYP domain-containing protein [Gallaecimonas mangrovi]|uniref:HD-GYP domain-containing protein n=1 Tax=Gallaecimonas mangrovi TaxID=2291597 RepID=UPI0018667BF0|nr:HD-GYP domain-containing protein [Gallaecimonas mangrovi]
MLLNKTKLPIKVEQLCLGLYVIVPLRWAHHPFLFNRFKIKTEKQIALIKSLGVEKLIVIPERSDTSPLPLGEKPVQLDSESAQEPAEDDERLAKDKAAAFALKQEQIERQQAYMRGLQRTEQEFQRALGNVKAVMQDMQRRPVAALEEASAVVAEVVDILNDQSDLVLHLMNEPKADDGFYCHSLNVSVLSMLLAHAADLDETQMKYAGLGGLFHDLGKVRVAPEILKKVAALTDAEQQLLQQHPQYGLEIVKTLTDFPADVLNIIAQHHEAIDGSGYPKGLKKEQITPLARLVAVANEYDNLCHGRRDKPGLSPHAVLSYLFKNESHRLDKVMLQHFIRVLGVYPPGAVVQLSDGQFGLVMSVNSSKLLSPTILLYDPTVPRDQAAFVDLSEAELTITKVVKPSALSEAVFDYLKPRSHVSYFVESKGR